MSVPTGGRVLNRLASSIFVKPAVRLDKAPLCTFTFDDCPRSALEQGGAMLEAAGAYGTFFVVAKWPLEQPDAEVPMLWGEDLTRAVRRGHEIGCHTFSHADATTLSRNDLEKELRANRDAVGAVLPVTKMVSFAYPFGAVSLRAKRTVASRFAVARGLRFGLNGRVVDLAELRACGIASKDFDKERILRLVRIAARRRSWLIFAIHDVAAQPSPWGSTPAQFEFILRSVRRVGIEILTLKAALGRITHRAPR